MNLFGTVTCQRLYTATPVCSGGAIFVPPNSCVNLTTLAVSAPSWDCGNGFSTGGSGCVTYATPTYSCSSGTLSGQSCVSTAYASVIYVCSSGTLQGSNCVTSTTVTTTPTYSCSSGTLSGQSCVSTAYASVIYVCSSGTLQGGNCVTTTTVTADPTYSCPAGHTLTSGVCEHDDPPPTSTTAPPTTAPPTTAQPPPTTSVPPPANVTINGLEAGGSLAAGTDYVDPFIVWGATASLSADSHADCGLAHTSTSLSGARGYTLTVDGATAGRRVCTVSAGGLAPEVAVTFRGISGLASSGTGTAGASYSVSFLVWGSAASVTGEGCSRSAATVLDSGARDYTLTVTREDAGERRCKVSGGGATVWVTVTFEEGQECTVSLGSLGSREVSRTGSWSAADGCRSSQRGNAQTPYYARWYTFTLDADAQVTIDLSSSQDPYLYLLPGHGTGGASRHYNDDHGSSTDSRLVVDLVSGDYTVEATTHSSRVEGGFTLTVVADIDAAARITGLAGSYSGTVGELVSFTFDYAPATAEPSLAPVTPSGLDLDLTVTSSRGTATVSGTPTHAGTYTAQFSQPGRTDTDTTTVNVACPDDYIRRSDRSCVGPSTVYGLDLDYKVTVGELFSAGFGYEPEDAAASLESVKPSGLKLALHDGDSHFGVAGRPRFAGTYTVAVALTQPGREDTHTFTVVAACAKGQTEQDDRSCADPECTTPLGAGWVRSGVLEDSGTWDRDCKLPRELRRGGPYYAKHFTFILSLDAQVTIDLTSATDTYLFLFRGRGPAGTPVESNDDASRWTYNSRLSRNLLAGTYTVTASTYRRWATGDFNVRVEAYVPLIENLEDNYPATVEQLFSLGFNYQPLEAELKVKSITPSGLTLKLVDIGGNVGMAGTPERADTYEVTLEFTQGSRTDTRSFKITATCPQGQAPSIHGDGSCAPAATVPSSCPVSALGASFAWWGHVYFEGPYTTYGSSAPQACTSLSESGRRAAYWRFTVPAHQESGGMPARVRLEVAKLLIVPVPLHPEAEAGYPSLTLWQYGSAEPSSAPGAVQFVASETSQQGAWHPTLDVSLDPGDYLIEVAPTSSEVGTGRFRLTVTVPTAERVHTDVKEVGNTGLNDGGMTLPEFLEARGSLAKSRSTVRSDPSDPTSPTHPWLAFTADWCSVPPDWVIDWLQDIVNDLKKENVDAAQYITQIANFDGERIPFYYACLRHDFNWRNLHRTKHHFKSTASGVWNGVVRSSADARFKEDLKMLCRANQPGQLEVPSDWEWTLSLANLSICLDVAEYFELGVGLVPFPYIRYSH